LGPRDRGNAGVRSPARIYDLRSAFASDALAAGIRVFELARLMGNAVEMIERHSGTPADGSAASITNRLDQFDSALAATEQRASGLEVGDDGDERVWAAVGQR